MLDGGLSFFLVTRLFARVLQPRLILRFLPHLRLFVPPLVRNVLALRKNTGCFVVYNLSWDCSAGENSKIIESSVFHCIAFLRSNVDGKTNLVFPKGKALSVLTS